MISLEARLRSTVHPRACGELFERRTFLSFAFGSSPRMRGTRAAATVIGRLRSVHPRACGELRTGHRNGLRILGSSPRMRGTLRLRRCQWRGTRFIPAHAGNSMPASRALRPEPVHPRACGELVHDAVGFHASGRFIPAHAGELLLGLCEPRFPGGSSPRMRGTPPETAAHRVGHRFIPAHAGNSRAYIRRWCEAYGSSPRMRGTLRGSSEVYSPTGSSPRMRGTRRPRRAPHHPGRFIPAHAGNSLPSVAVSRRRPVHPRACGELCRVFLLPNGSNGSSPRMRGTPHRFDRR